MKLNIKQKIGLAGEFKAILFNADGSIAYQSDWDNNLIVDNGLIIYGRKDPGQWYQACCIGSDAGGLSILNTTIGALLDGVYGGVNPMPYSDYPRPPVAPLWERYSHKKWRFDAGIGTGTVREFTLGKEINGTNIFCRHILTTPIVKAADQTLDVFYRFYIYPDLVGSAGTVLVNGTTYDWEASIIRGNSYNFTVFTSMEIPLSFPSYFDVYNGVPATINDYAPTGDSASGATKSLVNSGSKLITYDFHLGLDDCNTITGGFTCFTVPLSTYHLMQVAFYLAGVPAEIPKDNTMIATIRFALTWDRYTP